MFDYSTWFLGYALGIMTMTFVLHYYWTRIIEPVIKEMSEELTVCLDIMDQDQIDEFVRRT